MASAQPPEPHNPTADHAQLPDLELLDCDEDRIRFTAHTGPTDWPIDIWVAGRGPKPAWSLEACLTLTQLRQIVEWGQAVLEKHKP
jgi:hypothetical protein